MSAKAVLFDKVKAVCGTDMAAAERMGITRSTLSQFRLGKAPIPDERIVQMAKIAGENADNWLVLIAAEQSQGEVQRRWKHVAQRLGIAASLFALTTAVALAQVPKVWEGMHIMFATMLRRNKAMRRLLGYTPAHAMGSTSRHSHRISHRHRHHARRAQQHGFPCCRDSDSYPAALGAVNEQ